MDLDLQKATFRRVREDEVEHISDMAARAWRPVFESFRQMLGDALFDTMNADWEANKADQVRQAAVHRPDGVYVTEIDGRILGFMTFWIDEGGQMGRIGNNAVDPDWQGHGIGTFQNSRVLELMRERGVRVAQVTTGGDDSHAPARRAYEKAGFSRFTPSVTYYMQLNE